MPRTKINKNKATKRSRGAHDEKLQEFDLLGTNKSQVLLLFLPYCVSFPQLIHI